MTTSITSYLAHPGPRRRRRTSTAPGAAEVLVAVRAHKAEADAAEVAVLNDALAWAHLHQTTDEPDSPAAALWGDTDVPIAGFGAPLIAEFCIAEFAAAIGRTTESGRYLLAHALELAHRLPNTYARIQAGDLQVWRARRIAERTLTLTPDAAAFVDLEVAPLAHQVGTKRLDLLVEEAIGAYMPEHALERAQAAAETRQVTVHHNSAFGGTSHLAGDLDIADALDLENALRAGAKHLTELGSTEPLNVRRSQALGLIARWGLDRLNDREGSDAKPTRRVVLYVHTTRDNLSIQGGHATIENAGGRLITVNQLRTWCDTPGTTTKIVVKPVIDLVSRSSTNEATGPNNDDRATSAYEVPDRLREVINLRDRTCVFPHCNRPARRCDGDHIHPYDPNGPPGQTCRENLACLCRHHHRLKTFGGWTYTSISPGAYLWRSPHGYTYLRSRDGTRDVSPPPS